ncbi:MAG: hypothetical protein O3B65_04915 [Chloroflexi bacterium]|nr:hypothetical protein [Chloroflexota bacterium]
MARALRGRLADLDAASSVSDLAVGHPRQVVGKIDAMAIDLAEGYQIVFCANHPKRPLTASGDLDWSKVGRVRTLDIVSADE